MRATKTPQKTPNILSHKTQLAKEKGLSIKMPGQRQRPFLPVVNKGMNKVGLW